MAPELFDEEPKYSKPADIWSVGVLLYELCTLMMPFPSEKALIKEKPFVPIDTLRYSKEVRDLVDDLLEFDP